MTPATEDPCECWPPHETDERHRCVWCGNSVRHENDLLGAATACRALAEETIGRSHSDHNIAVEEGLHALAGRLEARARDSGL